MVVWMLMILTPTMFGQYTTFTSVVDTKEECIIAAKANLDLWKNLQFKYGKPDLACVPTVEV